MVQVIDFAVRTNGEGEQFIALILQGDLEMVQSKETGRYYATAKRCSVTSTFKEDVAKTMVGKLIPGRIIRQECEPYEYTVPETGEVLELNFSWRYTPEEWVPSPAPQVAPQQSPMRFSGNGKVPQSV